MTARIRAKRSPLADLTPRELEVASLVAEGKSNASIADSMFLTKRAVEKHINAIFAKLNLPDDSVQSRRVAVTLLYLSDGSEVPDVRGQSGALGPTGATATSPVRAAPPAAAGIAYCSVLAVDDHDAFRRIVRTIVEDPATDFDLAGEASCGEAEAAPLLLPDLILMDVRMPGMGGVEAARRIRELLPSVVIVLISVDG